MISLLKPLNKIIKPVVVTDKKIEHIVPKYLALDTSHFFI
jgi:hypothetical protein